MSDRFLFYSAASLVQTTPFEADSLPSLLQCLRRVDSSSIFHHFYHSLLRRHFLKGAYQNDFALWAEQQLREPWLAERLATVDPMDFAMIRAAREKLIEYVEVFVGPAQSYVRVPPGKEFRFQELMSFSYPSGIEAETLEEFAGAVRQVSVESVFYHVVEARLRLHRKSNDFSSWLDHSHGEAALAREIEGLNPYRYGLEDLKAKIAELVEARVSK